MGKTLNKQDAFIIMKRKFEEWSIEGERNITSGATADHQVIMRLGG